jgi:signal peptidase I
MTDTAQSFDTAVRKEAEGLLRQARQLLGRKKGPRGDELAATTGKMDKALAAGDLAAVRRYLPPLDGLVDELTEPVGKSVFREYTESIGVAIVIALLLRAFVIEAFKIPSSSMYPTLEIGDHIFVSKFLYGVRIPFSDTKLFQVRPPRRGEVAVFLWPCNFERDYIKRIVAVAGDTVELRCDVLYINGKAVPSNLINPADSFMDGDRMSVSRYREQLGGITYDTFHKDWRPAKEAQRDVPGFNMLEAQGENTDFPELRSLRVPTCSEQSERDPNYPRQVEGKLVRTADPSLVGECAQQMHYVVPPGHVFGMGDDRWNSNDSRRWGAFPAQNLKGKAMFIWFSYSHWALGDWSGVRWDRIGNFVH